MPNVCPCCKRRIPAPRKSATTDKRLEQDLARANAAIAALATAESRHTLRSVCQTLSPEYMATLRDAIASETRRLTRALTDHRLLWAIYRRADKTAPYYSEPVAQPQPVPQAALPAELVAA